MEGTTYFYNGFTAMIRVKHFLTELEGSIKGLAKTKEPNTRAGKTGHPTRPVKTRDPFSLDPDTTRLC
jgi:hypothetical protein